MCDNEERIFTAINQKPHWVGSKIVYYLYTMYASNDNDKLTSYMWVNEWKVSSNSNTGGNL